MLQKQPSARYPALLSQVIREVDAGGGQHQACRGTWLRSKHGSPGLEARVIRKNQPSFLTHGSASGNVDWQRLHPQRAGGATRSKPIHHSLTHKHRGERLASSPRSLPPSPWVVSLSPLRSHATLGARLLRSPAIPSMWPGLALVFPNPLHTRKGRSASARNDQGPVLRPVRKCAYLCIFIRPSRD